MHITHSFMQTHTLAQVTTLAGDGNGRTTEGIGTFASIRYIAGIAIDSTDQLYVSSDSDHVIYKISSSNYVSVFAGSGTRGVTGTYLHIHAT